MIKTFTSPVDGLTFEYQILNGQLEYKIEELIGKTSYQRIEERIQSMNTENFYHYWMTNMPDLFHSELLGYSFWIDENNIFMSAPTFRDGTADLNNSIPVSDWESFNELNEFHFAHLFGTVFTMCVYKRELVRVDYYANKFLPKVK